MENKKDSKKLLIIIACLMLVLAFVGGFYFYKNKLKNDNNQEVEDKQEDIDNKEEKELATPLLYEVTKDDEDTKIYLFGSIHAADDRAFPMQDKIMNAYNSSDYLAVEVDIVALEKDFSAQVELVQMLLCEDGKTLKDYLKPDTYNMLIEYLKDNKEYNKAYEMYRPGFIYSLLSNIIVEKGNLDIDDGIDMYFLNKATKSKKNILELESATSQYEMLVNLPDELYDYMIKSFIKNEQLEIDNLILMYEGWLEGDFSKLLESEEIDTSLLEDDLNEYENLEIFTEEYDNEMIYKRNEKMVKNVDNYFKEGKNVFVVVGAAHIVGETGLANKLSTLGYNVNIVKYE